MSADGTERMISVAELLRREGVAPAGERSVKGRVIASAAGVMALCGASVTGMLALAPNLSTAFFPNGTDDGVTQASPRVGGSSEVSGQRASDAFRRTGVNQPAESLHPLTGRFAGDLGFRAANHQVPAMSQLDSDRPETSTKAGPTSRSDAADEESDDSAGTASSTADEPEDTTRDKPKESKPAPSDEPPADEEAPDEEAPAENSSPESEEAPSESESEQPPAEEEPPAEETSSTEERAPGKG